MLSISKFWLLAEQAAIFVPALYICMFYSIIQHVLKQLPVEQRSTYELTITNATVLCKHQI